MKHLIGAFIISFGVLLVLVILVRAMGLPAPDDIMTYLGIAWLVLTAVCYPVARKIMRVD